MGYIKLNTHLFLLKEKLLFKKLGTPSQPSFKVLVDNEPVVRKDGVAVLKSGHTVELSCTSESGNPVTSLTFTKNGDNFGPEPVSHKITHAFQVTPEDNGALLGCTSQNQDNWQSESEALRLHVLCKFCPNRSINYLLSLKLPSLKVNSLN